MNRIYIVTIILLVIALIFAIQNIATVSLHFLFWKFEGSMSLVTIVIFVVGFAGGWLLETRKVWIKNSQLKTVQKKLDELQKTLHANSAGSSK
ncbi:MAG: LapA family protein [Chitinophagaceae bacterium]|nr:LapA family protein [Chitinophagaceae bacterium]